MLTLNSHKRLKAIKVLFFGLIVYDSVNDLQVNSYMIRAVDSQSFEDPCSAVNDRGVFYPRRISWAIPNEGASGTTYPDWICDDSWENYHESHYKNFSQYLHYNDVWLDEGLLP